MHDLLCSVLKTSLIFGGSPFTPFPPLPFTRCLDGCFVQKFVLLRPLLEFGCEIVISGNLEAQSNCIGCRHKQVSAKVVAIIFAKGKKGFPDGINTFRKCPLLFWETARNWANCQKTRKQRGGIVGQAYEEVSGAQREISKESWACQFYPHCTESAFYSPVRAKARAKSRAGAIARGKPRF